jgi:hypothetical protein
MEVQMFNFAYYLIFILFSLYSLIKIIGYCIYEFKNENNKAGSVFTGTFCLASIIFANICLFKACQ